MTNYAKLNSENIVADICVVDGSLDESEAKSFLSDITGHTSWVLTEKTGRINTASIGDIYDDTRDAFIGAKPYPSWVLNETTCTWQSPVACPDETQPYDWNEETQSWTLTEDVNE